MKRLREIFFDDSSSEEEEDDDFEMAIAVIVHDTFRDQDKDHSSAACTSIGIEQKAMPSL